MELFSCLMKSREQMERSFRYDQLGWWHDCCPGMTLTLRQATEEDLNRCWLRKTASRNPDDYMIQPIKNASLIPKKAILKMTKIEEAENVRAG